MVKYIITHNEGMSIACPGCGLTWIEIITQILNEGKDNDLPYPELDDDCPTRKRKQQLKTFW